MPRFGPSWVLLPVAFSMAPPSTVPRWKTLSAPRSSPAPVKVNSPQIPLTIHTLGYTPVSILPQSPTTLPLSQGQVRTRPLEDAVLEYPQSAERTRDRRNTQGQRSSQPNPNRFTIRRIIGGGDLWATEFILTCDGNPSYIVSIMEFMCNEIARETQNFAYPFMAPASRAQWVERMDHNLEAREFEEER